MQKFLFRFGYQQPWERRDTERYGGDFESSFCFFIRAHSEIEALAWGAEVAARLVAALYRSEGWPDPLPRWKEEQFAHWIELEGAESFALAERSGTATINVGEHPEHLRLE